MTTSRRGVLGLAAAVALASSLTACGRSGGDPNSIAAQARAGDGKGYISGDGAVEQVAVAQRGEPLQLSGRTLTGQNWSLRNAGGKVVVLNVWGSWCPPCVKEAPALQKVWTTVSKKNEPVQFMGIDTRESAQTGLAFMRSYHLTYPSLADDGGRTVLSLRGKAPATPTTLVLDPAHRIAARVSGPVDSSTLLGLVRDVLAESQ